MQKKVVMPLIYNSNYFISDRRIGDKCFVNGKCTYDLFNADLKSMMLQPGTIEVSYMENTGKSGLVPYGSTIKNRGLIIEFYVGGKSIEDTQINVSNLICACEKCIISTDISRFEYDAIMTAYDETDTGVEPYKLVTISFNVSRRMPLNMITLLSSGTFYNQGNTESGLCIKVTSKSTISNFTICGITIKTLTANRPFTIDGINGRVTENGLNKFSNTNLIDFPKAVPGKNEINMSANVTAELSFYPVFL